jgi:hypothetical protein
VAPNVDLLRAAGLAAEYSCLLLVRQAAETADLKINQDTYLTRTVDSTVDVGADDTDSGISSKRGFFLFYCRRATVFGNWEDRFS